MWCELCFNLQGSDLQGCRLQSNKKYHSKATLVSLTMFLEPDSVPSVMCLWICQLKWQTCCNFRSAANSCSSGSSRSMQRSAFDGTLLFSIEQRYKRAFHLRNARRRYAVSVLRLNRSQEDEVFAAELWKHTCILAFSPTAPRNFVNKTAKPHQVQILPNYMIVAISCLLWTNIQETPSDLSVSQTVSTTPWKCTIRSQFYM